MASGRTPALVAVCLLLLAGPAHASSIAISTRGGLGANDAIDWAQLGPNGVISPGGFSTTVTSNLGLSAIVSSPDFFGRLQQGTTFLGNFAAGDNLFFAFPGPIEITFASPVRGAGAQFQNGFGVIVVQLSAYDSLNNLLGQFSVTTNSGNRQDNSAVFLGILDSTADITRLVIQPSQQTDVNVNTLSVNTQAVPEPTTLLLLGTGLAAVTARRRLRPRRVDRT
jgi:hypothetical protein